MELPVAIPPVLPTAAPSAVPADPPMDIRIPDGDPAAGALALLAAVRPDAPSILAARIAGIDADLADQVEVYRLNTALPFVGFIRTVGRAVRLRATLRARAGIPSPATPSAEVLALAQAVRRWRTSPELKAERSRIVARLRGELARVERDIRADCDGFARGVVLGIGGEGRHHRATGLVHQHDEFLRRSEGSLRRRASILGRLGRLDAQGDRGRAAAAAPAIEAAGGVDAVAEALAPAMESPAAAELARVRGQVKALADQIAAIDPETRRAADLARRREVFEARIPALTATAAGERKQAAGSMVAAALTGGLDAIAALASAVGPIFPELAGALEVLRGGEEALAAVVDELVNAPDPASPASKEGA